MSEYEELREDMGTIMSSMESYARAVAVFADVSSDEIKRLWADNAELRDELHAVANRLEALTQAVTTAPAEVVERGFIRLADDLDTAMTLSTFDAAHVGEILRGHGTWFTAELLRLCAHADADNLERLRLGFPDVVAAYEKWRSA